VSFANPSINSIPALKPRSHRRHVQIKWSTGATPTSTVSTLGLFQAALLLRSTYHATLSSLNNTPTFPSKEGTEGWCERLPCRHNCVPILSCLAVGFAHEVITHLSSACKCSVRVRQSTDNCPNYSSGSSFLPRLAAVTANQNGDEPTSSACFAS
jgi:hypothetical protein